MLLMIDAVTKSFSSRDGQSPVLAEINFGIDQGEFVSLVGPSGCGKSTILALIAGLMPPSTGRITLSGSVVSKPGADRGMVFQQANLFPWLTVVENVTFGLTLKANQVLKNESGGISLPAQADALLEAVGLAAFRDHYPRQLSGGMRQRAALVRALVTNPRILLMDEPFGALDAQTREEMQELLLHLCQRQGTTVLFVTHDVEEALILSDRVLVMQAHPGAIIAEVPVPLHRPRNLEMRADPTFVEFRARVLDLLHHRVRKTISGSQMGVIVGMADAENRLRHA
jgi:NitT/TauT family transport system ATP-binding protein